MVEPSAPLCFVLMPFNRKPVGGLTVDFDVVYRDLLKPAIEAAGLTPLRADEEQGGGIIHKQMFERLLLCEYAVADLTGANANVFYELGVRHARLPRATVLTFADRVIPPFDLGPVRALPYRVGDDGTLAEPAGDREKLAAFLRAARRVVADSPLYELIEGYPDIDHRKADTFRARVIRAEEAKARLRAARRRPSAQAAAAVRDVEASLGPLDHLEAGVCVDLLLSYRAAADDEHPQGYEDMLRLIEAMPTQLARASMMRQQRAFALNRLGRRDDARLELESLIAERGPEPETNGLLGRVFKDEWEALDAVGDPVAAQAMLRRAIAAYRQGFEADWRDAYPGVNLVVLMELRDPPDPEGERLRPVVRYAAERRLAGPAPGYWDHASMLELAVLERDRDAARIQLGEAAASLGEGWEATTTLRTLRLLREARTRRGEDCAWIGALEDALRRRQLARFAEAKRD